MLQALDGSAVRWVPTAVARRMLRVSKQRVYQLVKEGKLASCRLDGVLMISSRSIQDRINGHISEEEEYA
jgi:hypothetical protein